MEYIYDEDNDMTMQEYFKKYKDKLPDLVIVTGGHYGLTQYDDYANDQVIRFTTYSSQPRVIARDSSGAKSNVQLEYLNIPVDTRYRFRVVHGARHIGPDERLSEIVKNHEVPILVRFIDTLFPELSSVEDPKRRRINYLIIKKFEENYLLGNCVTEGVVNPACTTAALTKNILVSRITGIKGKTDKEFKQILAEMDDVIRRKTKFNLRSGNPDMTKIVFNSDDTGTGATMDPDDPLIPKEVVFLDKSTVPPPLPPRHGSESAEGGQSDSEEYVYIPNPTEMDRAPVDIPPELPPRPIDLDDPPMYEVLPDCKVPYENDVQRCVVSPTTHNPDPLVSYTSLKNDKPSETKIKTKGHVSDLSIVQIGEVLEKLQLQKYVGIFKDNMIDGTILQELEKDDLVQDFNFTNVEAIRLIKFINTGHVPR